MPGPAPKHPDQRRRRNASPGLRQLPSAGRSGPPPAWPLPGKPKVTEASVWAEVWHTPQAVEWERLGWFRTVARYVRLLVRSERSNATAAVCAEVRQMEDRLGLTPMSMLRLRWEVESPEVAQARESGSNVRRLRAVDPAAG